jgi:hypothetical protein
MVSNKFGDLGLLVKIGARGVISEPPASGKDIIPLHIRSAESASSTNVQTSPSATLRRRRLPQMALVDNEHRIQGYVGCRHLFCLYLATLTIQDPLIVPSLLNHELPLVHLDSDNIVTSIRSSVSKIIAGHDERVLVVVGPCSIHSPDKALEYARALKSNISSWDNLLVIMRVCL